MWARDWGLAVAEAASAALAEEPATDLTLKDASQTDHWALALEGISLAPGHVRTAKKGSITEWPGFTEGAWWVQDLAASLPARLLPAKAGDRVLFGKDAYNVVEYHTYFRLLETDDEYFDPIRKYHGIWKLYGLDLSDDVLKKLYYKNALRIFPGLSSAGFP